MKKVLAALLALGLLLLPLCGAAEGSGYATPEEAVAAYIAGLQHNDLAEMLDAFAVETYVEHLDLETYVDTLKMYNFNSMPLPALGDFARQLNVETRRGEIVTSIRWQYAALARGPEAQDQDLQTMIPLKETPAAELLSGLYPEPGEAYMADIAFDGEFLKGLAWVTVPNYYSQKNLQNLARTASRYGVDGIQDLAALVKVEEKDYILFAAAYRYGDRWYMGQLGGILAMYLNLSATCGMLVPAEALFGMSDGDFEALWQSYRNDAELMGMVAEFDDLLAGIDWGQVNSAEDLDAATAEQLVSLGDQIQAKMAR